jgi:ABC-type sugar transport system ATPase subunit
VIAGFRPEHIHVANGASPDGVRFDARVDVVGFLGNEQLVHLVRGQTPLVAMLPIETTVAGGQGMDFAVPREKLLLFDAQSQERVAA